MAEGLKCGLEVHQQLDTGKLFCRCPSKLREEKPDIIVKRFLRPTASELGEFDTAALEAFEKGFGFVYEAFSDTNCLIELDCEPPKPADKQALETILKVALLCNSKVLDELFVMRKIVIDGSNTSGFQKTMLVSQGGSIKLNNGKEIGIQTIVLEEDAARPMQVVEEKKEIHYRLDRLGIPLIELATAPDISSPKEAKETALAIGNILRMTCKAKRGLGTIRQDLNVSIIGGARVEIKGCQNLELIDKHVEREMQRQKALLDLKDRILARKLKKEEMEFKVLEVGEAFANSESKIVKGRKVFGLKVKGFVGLLGLELQPERRFGTELAGYVKAKTGLKGILHSDELPAMGISEQEVKQVKEILECKDGDGFVLVVAEKEKAEKALKVVFERILQAFDGVPEETRNALEDGNTEYSRQLPGSARMYPETDLEPVKIEKREIERLKKELPLWPDERVKLYTEKFGLSAQLAEKMKLSNEACFFEKLLKKGFDATTSAVLLLEGKIQLRRERVQVKKLGEKEIEEALQLLKEKKLTKENLLVFLALRSKNLQASAFEILSELGTTVGDEKELRFKVFEIVKKNAPLIKEKGAFALKALMGACMRELKGKADGATIFKILKEKIEKAK